MAQKQRAVTPNEAIDGHVANMLAEATRLHKEAMARLDKPKADPLPQLREAMNLLEQAEILSSDAASYVDAEELDGALAELYRQQGEVRAMIGQIEARRVSLPQANTSPLIFIALFALAVLCVWAII